MSEQEQAKDPIQDETKPEEVVEPEVVEEEAEAGDSAYDELNKRYLRLLADFDNYKRRTSNEKEDIYKYGAMNLIKELLPVLDSFELALKNPPADAAESVFGLIKTALKKFSVNLWITWGKPGISNALKRSARNMIQTSMKPLWWLTMPANRQIPLLMSCVPAINLKTKSFAQPFVV